jgi:hypothetical protein
VEASFAESDFKSSSYPGGRLSIPTEYHSFQFDNFARIGLSYPTSC